MKIAPVSGDLLVQLAIGAAVIGAAWWAVRSTRKAVGDQLAGAAEWAENIAMTTLNPASEQNIVTRVLPGVDTGWGDPARFFEGGSQWGGGAVSPPINTGGATGSW